MLPFVGLTIVATVALLLAESRGSRGGVWVAKPLAAAGFIATALAAGATQSAYGIAILVGLLLSMGGDVLLIPREVPGAFRAGVLSFLLGHVAYAVAFFVLGVDLPAALVAALLILGPAFGVLRWLRPHVPPDLQLPVHAYVAVISIMLVGAIGAFVAGGPWLLLAGAMLFYLSDLSVARDRFVSHAFANALWGLPFYFGGQLLLAASVAAV